MCRMDGWMNEGSLFYNIIRSVQSLKGLVRCISYGRWRKLYWSAVVKQWVMRADVRKNDSRKVLIPCTAFWPSGGWPVCTVVFMFGADCLPESHWSWTFNSVQYVNLGENLHLYCIWFVTQVELSGCIFLFFFHVVFCQSVQTHVFLSTQSAYLPPLWNDCYSFSNVCVIPPDTLPCTFTVPGAH